MPAPALGLAEPLPTIRMRGRSVMALVLAPEFPMAAWFASLDRHLANAGAFFAQRPIVANLGATLEGGPEAPLIVLDGLEARGLRLVGVEGVEPRLLAGTRWEALPTALQGREFMLEAGQAEAASPAPSTPSLLIDGIVRSGQSIGFEDGDVTITGSVASGAEVVAGGSIHIYGALRGRAIAGMKSGATARIFCRRLEAEMVGVDRFYRTAEHWGPALHGRPAQVRCDRGALRLQPMD